MGVVMDCQFAIKTMRHAMDGNHPGWTETSFWCPGCRQTHTLVSAEKQLQMQMISGRAGAHPSASGGRRPPRMKPGAPEGWCHWHETASPQLATPCAWETCRTSVHVHRNALGPVKSGRAGKGFLVERCPACHRYNAIHPTYGRNAISASKLEGGIPVLQLNMRGIER